MQSLPLPLVSLWVLCEGGRFGKGSRPAPKGLSGRPRGQSRSLPFIHILPSSLSSERWSSNDASETQEVCRFCRILVCEGETVPLTKGNRQPCSTTRGPYSS